MSQQKEMESHARQLAEAAHRLMGARVAIVILMAPDGSWGWRWSGTSKEEVRHVLNEATQSIREEPEAKILVPVDMI